jgi:cytochrome oxidase Cu insertion factor (SCO1/SenC/PrrC family)
MSLAEILDRTRTAAEAKRSPKVVAQLHRAIDELRTSGILDHAVKAGAPMPPFKLPNQDGREVDSSALLAKGALVVTFYRGKW